MTMPVRPGSGGFLRPFGCGWFIREFLLGNAPQGSDKIDPRVGAPQTEVFDQYKRALHRAIAEDDVAWENEERIRKGLHAFTEDEYVQRLDWFLQRIPSKLVKCRYHSFITYFGMFRRLGWVEEVSQEKSGPQEYDGRFQPRRYYRLTNQGRAAPLIAVSDPLAALYSYPRSVRSAKRHRYYTRKR